MSMFFDPLIQILENYSKEIKKRWQYELCLFITELSTLIKIGGRERLNCPGKKTG